MLPVVQGASTVQVSVANLTAGRATAVGSLTSSGTVSASSAVAGGNFSGFQMDNPSAGSGSPPNTISLNFANFSVVKGRITAAVYGDGYMDFATDNDIAKMRITAGGDIKNNLGNYIVGTAAKGIDFSANTGAAGMTSELLDWYEEGTFTATRNGFVEILGGGSITSLGTYTRIGRQVFVNIKILPTGGATTAATPGIGSYLGGLPYTPSESSSGVWVNIGSVAASGSVWVNVDNNMYLTEGWLTSAAPFVFSATYTV